VSGISKRIRTANNSVAMRLERRIKKTKTKEPQRRKNDAIWAKQRRSREGLRRLRNNLLYPGEEVLTQIW
jgi:hypothetical protein